MLEGMDTQKNDSLSLTEDGQTWVRDLLLVYPTKTEMQRRSKSKQNDLCLTLSWIGSE